jgi:hypothetical protein
LFIESTLNKIVTSFIPASEIRPLPQSFLSTNDLGVFLDYIFAIEKYLNVHVLPIRYFPLYSSKITEQLKNPVLKKQTKRILKFFETGDKRINDKSVNILPHSAFHYFNDVQGKKRLKYALDFSYDFYSIRHVHLSAPDDDSLLFYVLVNKNILLLSIGSHKDIYEKDNLRILINEFPEFLKSLGINELTGIHPGIELEGATVKAYWEHGISPMQNIDGKIYASTYMTFSGITTMVHYHFMNIIYRVKTDTGAIKNSLNGDCRLFVKKGKSKLSIKYGDIYIGDRISNKEWIIHISYLNKLHLIEITNVQTLDSPRRNTEKERPPGHQCQVPP